MVVGVAAGADDRAGALAGGVGHEPGQARSPGALGEGVGVGRQEADGALDRLVVDQDEVVEAAAQHRLGEGEARPNRQPRHARAAVDGGRLPGGPGEVRGRRGAGLDADDPASGSQGVAHEAGACRSGA